MGTRGSGMTRKALKMGAALLTAAVILISVTASFLASGLATVTSCKNLKVDYVNGGWYTTENGKRVSYTGVANNASGWWYCKNGQVDFNYTGLASNDLGTWFCRKGKVDFDYTGAQYGNHNGKTAWWRIEHGKVNPSYTGVNFNEAGWWYFKNGQVDFSFTGYGANAAGWWLAQDGKITFQYTGARYGTVDGTAAWWRVENSKVNKNYTGVNCNEAGWWYFKNGKVDFSYTGLASNAAGVWRIEKGQVNFGYEGIQKYNSKWWYLKNGKINTGYTGAVKGTINNTTGYWRTVNGEINTTYTGLGSIPDGNRMYFSNGTINFSYNGFAKDGNTWYYVKNGAVTTSYTGVQYGKVNGTEGWWRVESGKVNSSYNGIASNDAGYWYLRNGKVDFSANGLVVSGGSTWYVESGKVNFDYAGIYTDSSGVSWYIKNGKVDTSYSGSYKVGSKTYTVVQGKVTATATTSNNTYSYPVSGSKVVTDISRWNGDVNFRTMKNSGVKGVMLRAAYGTYEDQYFDAYGAACEREGLAYGVYQFATWHYGTTKAEAMNQAKTEANALIGILSSRKLSGYVALDLELESGATLKMTPAELTEVANYYLKLIQNAGYHPMLYCSISWLTDRMVVNSISCPLWIAYYYNSGSNAFPSTGYGKTMLAHKDQIKLWQFTSSGEGAAYGCSSQYVDLSYLYGNFTP